MMTFAMFISIESQENQKSQKNGDLKNELENLSEEYYMSIYKYCYIRLENNKSYSYDITNEVFVLLCEKWEGLKKENVKAWLYRTADNMLKSFYRKNKKRSRELVYIEDLQDFIINNNLSYEQDFDNISEYDIEIYRNEILGELSDKEREFFNMVFIEKRPYAEICEKFSITRENFKKRLYRLRQKIKEAVSIKVK